MNLTEVLAAKELRGQRLTDDESSRLQRELGAILPTWLLNAMRSHPLIGVTFVLSEADDESGLGVEMRWLDVNGMISEGRQAYPGMAASALGFIPIGSCLLGSGDPYFLRNSADPDHSEVVRIPHEAVDADGALIEGHLESVAPSLVRFIEAAAVE